MELREFGPDDASSVGAFVETKNACRAVDTPWLHEDTPYRRRMEMIPAWDGEPGRHFLAFHGGAAVGTLTIDASNYDNLELAWLGLDIHPDHRRQGHGTAALEAAYPICREMGRPLLGADGWESERALAFAAATGFELKSQAINRRQRLAELPAGLVDKLYDDALAQAGDYELLRFSDRTPDELIAEVAQLTGAINDAPLDDLEMEDEAFPPERIRAYEAAQRESGFRFRRLVARHRATGELAGHTVVTVDSERP
jgi:GNAT superfamily N-acetyltransferase